MNEYLLETKLKEESPELHRRMRDSITVLHNMLDSFYSWFPDFTDHSILHSMDVLYFSNQIIGEQVHKLSAWECYVLIMACYLHDIGMGISRKDYEEFSEKLDLAEYRKRHPTADEAKIIRDHHNEFSGMFIRKYADLFDIPSEEILFAIIQVCRGHRKTDLLDESEYPTFAIEGEPVRTAFLSAVIRLADEIDVGADRNPELLFDTSKLTKQVDIDAFGTHESIRTVTVTAKEIILSVRLKEPRFQELVEELAGKVQHTLDYCREAAQQRPELGIRQETVKIEWVRENDMGKESCRDLLL